MKKSKFPNYRSAADTWETFVFVPQAESTYAINSFINHKYVAVMDNQTLRAAGIFLLSSLSLTPSIPSLYPSLFPFYPLFSV